MRVKRWTREGESCDWRSAAANGISAGEAQSAERGGAERCRCLGVCVCMCACVRVCVCNAGCVRACAPPRGCHSRAPYLGQLRSKSRCGGSGSAGPRHTGRSRGGLGRSTSRPSHWLQRAQRAAQPANPFRGYRRYINIINNNQPPSHLPLSAFMSAAAAMDGGDAPSAAQRACIDPAGPAATAAGCQQSGKAAPRPELLFWGI